MRVMPVATEETVVVGAEKPVVAAEKPVVGTEKVVVGKELGAFPSQVADS